MISFHYENLLAEPWTLLKTGNPSQWTVHHLYFCPSHPGNANQLHFVMVCSIRVWPLSNWIASKVSVSVWKFPCGKSLLSVRCLDRGLAVGNISDYMKTAEGKQVGIQRKLSPSILPLPSSLSNLLKTQQSQLTSLITTAIGLPLHGIEWDVKPDEGVMEGSGCRYSGVLMGSSAAKGGNKSGEWKIRKHNSSHHCQLPLSQLSCRKSEACVSAQLLHLLKWDSQPHEVRPHILSICSSATTVRVWMKGGTQSRDGGRCRGCSVSWSEGAK